MMSVPLPAVNGTMMWIGRSGYPDCASAAPAISNPARGRSGLGNLIGMPSVSRKVKSGWGKLAYTAREEERMADGSTTTWKGGTEHWTKKGEVKLFLWNKKAAPGAAVIDSPGASRPRTLLFVHGSSMASQPTFYLFAPGRPESSAMDWFAARGYDTWTMDNEGYGRSDKQRPINCDIANGADDLAARRRY